MSQQKGWECPRCGRCYAPVVLQCNACGPFESVPLPAPVPDALQKGVEKILEEHRKYWQPSRFWRLDPGGVGE
jgi:hypothetical protein